MRCAGPRPAHRGAAVVLPVLALLLGATAVRAVAPGAYCPLPQAGEKPKCLEPAVAAYGEFFEAVEAQGPVSDEPLARVEADVAAGGDESSSYLALSSLAYGYYRLSQRAAEAGGVDADVARRLERWNALLAQAYETHAADDAYRRSLREAAVDLHARAPGVEVACEDAAGQPARCGSTEALLRALHGQRDSVGVRGALGRLLERWFGDGDG